MAVLPEIRYYQDGEPYSREIDNRPLHDLADGLTAINVDLIDVQDELEAARGDSTLEDKLQHFDDDGVLAEDGIGEHPISEHSDTDDYVRMTADERIKLAGVSSLSNRLQLHVDEPGAVGIDGDVVIQGGQSIRIVKVPTSSDVNLIRIDTAFSPDRIHEHRYGVRITRFDGTTATIPNGESYIAGSLCVFLNGLMLPRNEYTEVSPFTSFRLSTRQVDLSRDVLTVSYEAPPSWDELTSDPSWTWKPAVKRWVRDTRLGQDDVTKASISFVLEDGTEATADAWMIDISSLEIVEPYDLFRLFRNGTLVYYGIDWDIVTLDGKGWLRWRYYGDSSDLEAWLIESSDLGFAESDLAEDDELQLDYNTRA